MVRKTCVVLFLQIALVSNPITLLLDWWPNPHHVPLYYGIERGIFMQEGIELQLRKNSEAPNTVSFVAMKNVDAALFYMPQAMRAAEKFPTRILCSLLVKPLQGLLKRRGTKVIKKIGGYPGTFYRKIAEKCGKDTQKVQIDNGLTLALYFDHVDAIYGGYPTIEGNQLKASGVETEFVSSESLGIPSFSELVVIVHKDCNTELAHCLKRALSRSIEAALHKPEDAFEAYLKANPDKTPYTISWEKLAWKDTLPLLGAKLDSTQINTFHTWMKKEHLLSETAEVSGCLFETLQ